MEADKPIEKIAYSVKEAAAALGISESAVYWMCYRKEIPHRRTLARGKKGKGKILIPVEEVKRWLRGEDVKPKLEVIKKKGGKVS